MTFILSEFSNAPKHYRISYKRETPTGIVWDEVAKITKRKDAFNTLSLLEQLSKVA